MIIHKSSSSTSLTALIYNNDHIYEEIKEKKDEKICLKCNMIVDDSNDKPSVVYSDRLIYKRKNLNTQDVILTQIGNNLQQMFFPLKNNNELDIDYMPSIFYNKSNKIGILDSTNQHLDDNNSDLPNNLTPGIEILDDNVKNIFLNTELYHRIEINYHFRMSNILINEPMIFLENQNKFSYYYNKSNNNNEARLSSMRKHYHRSSLLLLEPLLMISSSFSKQENQINDNRITTHNSITVTHIVIVYTLSFLLLLIFTIYTLHE